MPVYNGEAFLHEAIHSVLRQTFTDFEFVIVDDGSTDGTSRILNNFASQDCRLRVYERPNGGIVDALNFGLARCRGEYIARMDADDVCLPKRFAFQVAFLDRTPSCVIVGGTVMEIDEKGVFLGTRKASRHSSTNLDAFPPCVAVTNHPLAMIRRDALLELGGYRKGFAHAEDYDMFLRIGKYGSVISPDEVLLYYRKHEKSVSDQHVLVQETNAAYSELSAIFVHLGKQDPADDPRLDHESLRNELRTAMPDWLFQPYIDFRIWRRLREIDAASGRFYFWRVLRAAMSVRPVTVFSSRYWSLRLRILGRLTLNCLQGKGASWSYSAGSPSPVGDGTLRKRYRA